MKEESQHQHSSEKTYLSALLLRRTGDPPVGLRCVGCRRHRRWTRTRLRIPWSIPINGISSSEPHADAFNLVFISGSSQIAVLLLHSSSALASLSRRSAGHSQPTDNDVVSKSALRLCQSLQEAIAGAHLFVCADRFSSRTVPAEINIRRGSRHKLLRFSSVASVPQERKVIR